VLILDTLAKIVEQLKKNNKSQKTLTDFLGVHSSIFSEWKKGKNTSYLKHISKIADFLEVSTDYLLGNEQKEKSPLSDIDSKLLNAFEQLSDEGKVKALEYIDLLREARK